MKDYTSMSICKTMYKSISNYCKKNGLHVRFFIEKGLKEHMKNHGID